MRGALARCAAVAGTWVPATAFAQAQSAAGAAGSLANRMTAGGAVVGTALLAFTGYLLLLGMGNRTNVVAVVVGLIIVLAASYLAGLVS